MQTSSTPLSTFHAAVRAVLDDKDDEVHTHYDITEKMKVVLNTGKIRGYKLSADTSSVEPALTPDSNHTAYELLLKKTALMFRRSLSKDQIFALEAEIYHLENGGMCGSF